MKPRAISVDSLVQRAVANRSRRIIDQVKAPEIPADKLAAGLRLQVDARLWWFDKFGAGPMKKPDHEINARRHELAVLVQAADRLDPRGANATEPASG